MSDFKNFMRLYCEVSCTHYSRVFELIKLYKSDKEKYKPQFSRVLSCFSIWQSRNARIKELEAIAHCPYQHEFKITRDGYCNKCGWSQLNTLGEDKE